MPDLPSGTVTLLFSDIEGSTRLVQRLGEGYGDVLAVHQELLRAAFTAHGGREVDTQGDAFFVAFSRAEDAVRAAVTGQRALAEHAWPGGISVSARMGLHTGEPRATAAGYIGMDVHRAARVAASGHGGQVLLTQTTADLVRHRLPDGAGLRDLGEHELKDLEGPERLYQLVIPGRPSAFPPLRALERRPIPLPLPPAPPLVDRQQEQQVLRDQFAAAMGGSGGLVLLSGEAGIGKTALAEALAREARAQGALVLLGRCYDLRQTPPYGPWAEAARHYPATSQLPPLPFALATLVAGGTVDNLASQAALFAEVWDFLAAVAAQRPLLVLLDDLHWADAASLELLRYLGRWLAEIPLLLVATYRADEVTRGHPLYQFLPVLVRETRATRLNLRPLDDEAVRDLVRAHYQLPDADEARLVAYLRDHAEGNPFFAGEWLRALEEEGLLSSGAEDWTLGELTWARVPLLLQQVIDGRLARLGEEVRRLLAIGAVIGPEVPLGLWAAVGGVAEEDLLDVVERAVEAGVLEESPDGGRVCFAHGLIRKVNYEALAPSRRRAWHRRVGEALVAGASPDPDAVAYHFQQAGDARAIEWLIRAGERAQRAYAWLTAAGRFEAALALMERHGSDARERGWLLFRLGRLRRYEDPQGAIRSLEAARRLAAAAGDRALAAYSRFYLGLPRCFVRDYGRGVADLEAGVAAVDALAPAERAEVVARNVGVDTPVTATHRATLAAYLAMVGRHADALTTGAQALAELAAAAESGLVDRAAGADAYYGLACAHAALGRPADAHAAYAAARAAYGASENAYLVAVWAAEELLWVTLPYEADRPAERAALAAEAERALARASNVRANLPPRSARLPLLLLEGAWGEARQLALTVRATLPEEYFAMPTVVAALAYHQGDADLAWTVIRENLPARLKTAPGEASFDTSLTMQRLAAALALNAGDLATAKEWLVAHDRWLAWGGAVLGRAEGQLGWAAYHRAEGDLASAREHAERALALAAEPRQPLALLAAHRLLGVLDVAARRPREAAVHLDDALALADACGAPYERALTLLALAELQIETAPGPADRAATEALLDEVRAICLPLGAAPALARADRLAARLASARPPAIGYPAGLTAREAEVLRLVAEGLTDAQVAERLFLSPRTVGQHLRSIYNKLGVSTRLAATRFAIEHRLA